MGAVALVAGASPFLALAAGASMTALQLGIGTANDVVDAPHDAGRKPGKPIPAGFVPAGAARWAVVGWFAIGTAVAAAVAPRLGVLAILVIAIGLLYDLRLKGTAWSWLPFAIGIPILPVYGWLTAREGLDGFFAILLPAAVAAGAALAIGNALVDVDRDAAAGRSSIALAVGEHPAGLAVVGLLGSVGIAAAGSAALAGSPVTGAIIAAGLPGVGAAVAAVRGTARQRELAWRIEAVGTAVLALTWLLAVLARARA